jgi:hypothetical protein
MVLTWWVPLNGICWRRIPSLPVTPASMATVLPTPAGSNEKLAHSEVVSISSGYHCAAYIRLIRKLAGLNLSINGTLRL